MDTTASVNVPRSSGLITSEFGCKYLRVASVLRAYPFSRSMLYEKMKNGEFRSFVIKHSGTERGIRVIDRESLDAYLEAQAKEATS